MAGICPNCGGELVRRPIRPTEKLINNAGLHPTGWRSSLLSGMSLLQHSHPDQLNMNGPGKMISLHKVDFLPLR
jgi:hypothetical protein